MIGLLSRLFIKNHNDLGSPETRSAYGTLCGALGIVLNALISGAKFFVGAVSCSVSVTADAFNNLSDAASSVITLVGFRIAGHAPDSNHPFGHGRFEYITGLFISGAVVAMGAGLLKSSVEKMFSPSDPEFSYVGIAVLVLSVCVKLYMWLYNRSVGSKINSVALKAAASDSISDCIATTAVLLSAILFYVTKINIDAYCGAAVSAFIIVSGVRSAREAISSLLGGHPDGALIEEIKNIVLAHPEITGIHDLIVHDYGLGRMIVSLHAEMPDTLDIRISHDVTDLVERELSEKLGCEAVIHMDPIDTDDERTNFLKSRVLSILGEMEKGLSIHDFRIVSGETHTNIIFDLVIPYGLKKSDDELKNELASKIKMLDGSLVPVIKVDKFSVR